MKNTRPRARRSKASRSLKAAGRKNARDWKKIIRRTSGKKASPRARATNPWK